MILRALFFGIAAIGFGLFAVMTVAPSLMLSKAKNDLATSFERAGIDTKECKKSASIFDPSGGVEDCMRDAFRQINKSVDDAATAADLGDSRRRR